MSGLTVRQLEEAVLKVLENARELLEDAELLLENGRYARAYSLAHLAFEEMAKIPMIIRAASETIQGKEGDWSKLRKRLTDHISKVTGGLMWAAFAGFIDETTPDEDIQRMQRVIELTPEMNKWKNWSIYADRVGRRFQKPSETISPDIARRMVRFVREQLPFYDVAEEMVRVGLENLVRSLRFQELMATLTDPIKGREDSET